MSRSVLVGIVTRREPQGLSAKCPGEWQVVRRLCPPGCLPTELFALNLNPRLRAP